MAAAAAVARKSAQSQAGPDRLPQWVVESGYTTIPNVVIDRLLRCLTYTEFGIVLILLRETVGAQGRPEWAKLTEQELADAKGVSVQEASESLKSLELRKKLIEARKVGRRREYRVIPERLALVEERQPRTLQKAEPKPASVGREFTLEPGQPRTVTPEKPATEIQFWMKGGEPISIEPTLSGSILNVFIKLPTYTITPVGVFPESNTITPVGVSGQKGARRPKVETITGVGVSPPKEEQLRELLTPVFLSLFHRKPDDPFLHQVERELKTATVEHYGRVVHKRVQQGDASRIKSGLFVTLARETAEASIEIAKRQPKPAPPPKLSTFVPEPEHSTSPWAKIRRELRQHISPQEYSNWLARARHGKLDDRRHELTIVTADQVTIDFISQEYEELIFRCAKDAGIQVSSVRYRVAEENS